MTSDGTEDQTRQEELTSLLSPELRAVPEDDRAQLVTLLRRYHSVFSLKEGERGETDLTEVHIETGEATPRRQPMRRTPHTIRREVAWQLQRMQEDGVIRPSNSPWASSPEEEWETPHLCGLLSLELSHEAGCLPSSQDWINSGLPSTLLPWA